MIVSEVCPFAPVVRLLISELMFGLSSGTRFRFERSTLSIGKEMDDYSVGKSLLEDALDCDLPKLQ